MSRVLGALLGVAAMFLLLVPVASACAPPPAGWVRVYPPEEYVGQLVPTVVAFLIPGYFAWVGRRSSARWLFMIVALATAAVVFVFTVLLGMSCGHYAPP